MRSPFSTGFEIGRGAHLQHLVGILADGTEEACRLAERLAQRSLGLALELDEDRADLKADAACLEQRQPGAGKGSSLAVPQLAIAELEQQVEVGVGDHGGSLGGGRRGRRGCVAFALPDVDIAAPAVRFVRWPYKTRRWVERVDADSHGHGSTRMSFERPTGAGSRADQSTVRRANLGVVLKQIAAGAPRSRARVAAETGLTRGTVSSLVGELIELDLLRETGEDEHVGRVGRPAQTLELARPDRCHRPRGQCRLPGRLRRGPDRRDPLRASRPHR